MFSLSQSLVNYKLNNNVSFQDLDVWPFNNCRYNKKAEARVPESWGPCA